MSDLHEQPDDATPLTPEEREGLIPTNIGTRKELNEVEQANIYEATTWALLESRGDPLEENFGPRLHKRMFGKVWKWAGDFRTSDKNIGNHPYWEVPVALRQVLSDVRYWVENKTYPPDEIAARFHRAVVWVHPFPNGNGRWSRLMADILLTRMGEKPFSWGGSALRDPDATRKAYIDALHAADDHDFGPLLAFVRT